MKKFLNKWWWLICILIVVTFVTTSVYNHKFFWEKEPIKYREFSHFTWDTNANGDQYEAIFTIKYNSVNLLTMAKLDSMIRSTHGKACDINTDFKKLEEDGENTWIIFGNSTTSHSIDVDTSNWVDQDSITIWYKVDVDSFSNINKYNNF